MDPLSDVLSLLKPRSYSAGGFALDYKIAVSFPKHDGIKCYAVLSGQCWLVLEGEREPVLLRDGDCFLLPHGRPFLLTTDLELEPVDFHILKAAHQDTGGMGCGGGSMRSIVGGHFALSGKAAAILLRSLPPVVHIRKEADKAAMRWSLERMREELRNPQPGGALIAQQLAYMMLVQALRLHVAADAGDAGWLSALADQQMSTAIGCMHEEPGHPWTLQALAERVGMSRSIFALRFKEKVGATPMEYLTRWRMLLAGERLTSSGDSLSEIASSLGYESESAFGKAFRRVMGCSPRQYSRS